MNKFRILTTNGEWVYSQVNVLEDRIVCPILNAQGAQFLKPNIKFLPDTYGELAVPEEAYKEIYKGDILMDDSHSPFKIDWDEMCLRWIAIDSHGTVKPLPNVLTSSEPEIIGNIHENPELLEEKNELIS